MNIRIGTRGSKLALWQANYIADLLSKANVTTEIVTINTKGDKILDVSISKIGSKGVFTEEIEEALASDEIDIAVHSAKDMPSDLPDGFELIAYTKREKVNDVIVSHNPNFQWEPENSGIVLGTSSTRRIATLKHYYPNVKTVEIRGNLQTRIRKMQEGLCDGIILAYAGVHRMEYDNMIAKTLSTKEFTPAVGQGSIAIEVHSNLSAEKLSLVRKAINHKETEYTLLAERAYLRKLQGGCSIPAFCYGYLKGNEIALSGGIISLDGKNKVAFNLEDVAENAVNLGEKLGDKVLNYGGKEILDKIKQQL